MKYNQGILETVVRTVPVGNVVADTAYVIGAEILVAVEDGTAGADGVFVKRGCCGLEFLAGDEPAAGAACYLNNTTHKIEATPSATNYLIGCRNSNLESDIPATHVMVDLDGTAAVVYGVPGDIQGVTAGTGLTGGGTSGTPTLSVDFGTGSGEVCEGNDSRLSDARTPAAHAQSHATGEDDAIAPGDIGAATADHAHDDMVGDNGMSGGKAGFVPAPAVGDAASGKFLKASGAWAVPDAPTGLGIANMGTSGKFLVGGVEGFDLKAGAGGAPDETVICAPGSIPRKLTLNLIFFQVTAGNDTGRKVEFYTRTGGSGGTGVKIAEIDCSALGFGAIGSPTPLTTAPEDGLYAVRSDTAIAVNVALIAAPCA